MSQNSDNIEAINEFMHRTTPATPAAAIAFNDWVQWYEETKPSFLGFWSDADFDHARNLRNAFNRANAVTAAEKKAVEQVIKTGVSSEQAAGETDRRNAAGNIVELTAPCKASRPPVAARCWSRASSATSPIPR